MNKIITYVIIGVVVVLLLVAGGFGVKYALGKFLSGDSDKKKMIQKLQKPTSLLQILQKLMMIKQMKMMVNLMRISPITVRKRQRSVVS